MRLASNTLATLQSDFKVKIDDSKNHIDIDISRKNGMTEANAKEQVMIFVQLPSQYIDRIEASINAGRVEVKNLNCENLELETKDKVYVVSGSRLVDTIYLSDSDLVTTYNEYGDVYLIYPTYILNITGKNPYKRIAKLSKYVTFEAIKGDTVYLRTSNNKIITTKLLDN